MRKASHNELDLQAGLERGNQQGSGLGMAATSEVEVNIVRDTVILTVAFYTLGESDH
jgi:hypothetical protein